MSTDTATTPRRWIAVSYPSVVLAGLLLATQAAVLAAVNAIEVTPEHTTSSPAFGGYLAGVIVVETLVIVALWRLYPRLPAWLQSALRTVASYAKKTVVYGLATIAGLGYGALAATSLWPATVVVGAIMVTAWYGNIDGLEWIPHNLAAFFLSVVLVTALGIAASPIAVIAFLILTLVWDYTAVTLSDIMEDLVNLSASTGLPNFYVIPSALRIDSDSLSDWLADSNRGKPPSGVASVVGVGDIALPSLLVVSAAVKHGFWSSPALLTVAGSLVAVGVLTAALESSSSGLPALVWLNPGVILGYAAGIGITVIL